MTWNIPNTLTLLRFVLAIGIFVLLPFQLYAVCIVLFLLAMVSDFFDGYFARKYNQITVFGRIMDPFADKFLICGCFIYFASMPELQLNGWGILPWMAILIVGREILVTSLRATVEKSGGDFSAVWINKVKMALQCVTVFVCLVFLEFSDSIFLKVTMLILVWATVLHTAYSGTITVIRAMKMINSN